ncbi:MAG: hypothetical protein U0800_05280 [Isosphaeraceae bacterium]
MSSVRLVRPWLAAALALTSFTMPSAAQSGRPDPDAVLKKANLQRTGHSFVLDSELEANKLEKTIEQLQAKVNQERLKQEEGQQLLAQAQQIRNQAAASRQQGRAPRGARGSTNNQYNTLINQAQQLEQQARQRMGANNNAALNKDAKQLDDDQQRYQSLVNKTKKAYEDLYKQEDVVAALRKLNHLAHPKVALGPIPQYVQNVARQCSDELLDMGLTREKDLFHPTEDDKLAQEISALALRHRKAVKAGESDPSLSKEVAALRSRAEEAEVKREQLAGDGFVKDLVAEVQKATKSKVRVGTSPRLQRALHDLQSLEKELEAANP